MTILLPVLSLPFRLTPVRGELNRVKGLANKDALLIVISA